MFKQFFKKFDNKNLEKFIFSNIKKTKINIQKPKNVVIIRIIYPMSNSRANNISLLNYKTSKTLKKFNF